MTKLFNLKALIITLIVTFPTIASAVTQKEMEQARTIATKAYLRYANDGSGYLDDLNPTTMEELESHLKAKEKENIKAFKEIPVPSDYKSWDKEKLVEYWAVTAFQNTNLLEKGRGGRLRARSQINKMTISAPQPESNVSAPPSNDNQNSDIAKASPSVSENPAANTSENPAAASPTLPEKIQAQEDEIVAQEEELNEETPNVDKASSDTWVYIMVLAILVAIVIALVVYAANVMKKNNRNQSLSGRFVPEPHTSEKIEHLEATLSDKNAEILMLNKKLESANRQNSELKAKLESLTSEVAALRSGSKAQEKEMPEPEFQGSKPKATSRSIFLGRANAKGIFVRADRTLNVGNSVFVLETSDGFSGTFKVADSPAAWSLALSNPKEYLETACTGYDLDNTSNASQIITETSGTAVFEGGCWRVIRKARIRYE